MYKSIVLPYNYNGLEPIIDEQTVYIHFNRHYLGYLEKLNKLLNSINYDFKYTKEELVNHIDEIPLSIRDDVLYNLGGVLNHELYFTSMSDIKKNKPIGLIEQKINSQYGNYENFKNEFIKTASYLVGSGYTFLVVNKKGDLEIINTIHQETPYLYDLKPIMTLDLWEHAYYLLYKNKRSDYILNFFEIIYFDQINKNYEIASKKI